MHEACTLLDECTMVYVSVCITIFLIFFVATDHAGQTSTAYSQHLSVDVSPPVIGRPYLGVAYAATAKAQLLPQWELINDPESGVLSVFWALGSETGLSDLTDWTEIAVSETSAAVPAWLNISDGQSIALTIMVSE